MKIAIEDEPIELTSHPLRMAFSIRHLRKDGSVFRGRRVFIDISQIAFTRDIHLDNLGLRGIVGVIQVNVDWSSLRVSKWLVWWGMGPDQNFYYLVCQVVKDGFGMGFLVFHHFIWIFHGLHVVKSVSWSRDR